MASTSSTTKGTKRSRGQSSSPPTDESVTKRPTTETPMDEIAEVRSPQPLQIVAPYNDLVTMRNLQSVFTNVDSKDLETLVEKEVFSLSELAPRTVIMIHSWVGTKGDFDDKMYCQTVSSFRGFNHVTLNIPGRFMVKLETRVTPVAAVFKGTKTSGTKTIHMLEFIKPDVVERAAVDLLL